MLCQGHSLFPGPPLLAILTKNQGFPRVSQKSSFLTIFTVFWCFPGICLDINYDVVRPHFLRSPTSFFRGLFLRPLLIFGTSFWGPFLIIKVSLFIIKRLTLKKTIHYCLFQYWFFIKISIKKGLLDLLKKGLFNDLF